MYINDAMELLTVYETAQILKVAPITVRRYIAYGKLAAVKAGKGVRVRNDKDFSFTDATTFSVMDRLEIGTAFSFDHNFIQYGFATMGPDFPN